MPTAVGHGLQGRQRPTLGVDVAATQDSAASHAADKISSESILYRPCVHVQTAAVANRRAVSASKPCRSVMDGLSSLSLSVSDCS